MAKFKLGPFTPHFRQIFDCLELDLCGLFQYFSSAVQVHLRTTSGTTLLVEFGKVDIQPVKVRRSPSRIDGLKRLSVSFNNLRETSQLF